MKNKLDHTNLSVLVQRTELDFDRFKELKFKDRKQIFFEFCDQIQIALIESDYHIICYTLFKTIFNNVHEIDNIIKSYNYYYLNYGLPKMIIYLYKREKFNLN